MNPILSDVDFTEVDMPETEVNSPEQFAHALIEWAAEQNASDLFLSDEFSGTVVRTRQMGQLHLVKRLTRSYGRRLQNHIRTVAGLSITEVHRPIDGRNRINTSRGELDIRLSVVPTVFGNDLAVRIFNPSTGPINLLKVGFDEYEMKTVRHLLDFPGGLILVSGPTGSGKTNTLYAFLQHLANGKRKIHAIEDPVEYMMPGIIQSQVNSRVGPDFAELLHGIMRQSPDVIMIGEIRDQKTAEIAIRAGVSGHKVLATIHAQSTATAAQNLIALGTNPHFVADALSGVISQRLVRRLCEKCRRRMSVEVDGQEKIWFRAVGCDACFNGYDRQTMIAEIMEVNRPLRRLISQHSDSDSLRQQAINQGMRSLEATALERIKTGLISPDEAAVAVSDPEVFAYCAYDREAHDQETLDREAHELTK